LLKPAARLRLPARPRKLRQVVLLRSTLISVSQGGGFPQNNADAGASSPAGGLGFVGGPRG
jgi:hypothetical protein